MHMKRLLIFVLALSTFQSFAQKTSNPEAFAKTITPAELKKHLAIVAGKDMEGRETATEGQRRASLYIESQFKRVGLKPGNNGSYQLFYPVYQDSLTGAMLEVNGKVFQMDADFNASSGNIPATMRFNEVVFVGTNSMDSLKNANLAGRLVIVIGGALKAVDKVAAYSVC